MDKSELFEPIEKCALSAGDLQEIMYAGGGVEKAKADSLTRACFIWAVANRVKDIHILCHKEALTFSFRSFSGFVHFEISNTEYKLQHVKEKIFALTNTPQGGSTAALLSTRFTLSFPLRFAEKYNFKRKKGLDTFSIEVRVEYGETFDGYAIECRLHNESESPLLEEMNLSLAALESIKSAVLEPSGLILVTGPTGSGKTTLLHAILKWLNDGQRKILTIEDPVELPLDTHLKPVAQFQVTPALSFSKLLRSSMRRDPDVILIGEIRDQETMETALNAAQTGHLVLATLHSNNGIDTINRSLGILPGEQEAATLAEVLKLVIAQRLIPRYKGAGKKITLDIHDRRYFEDNGVSAKNEWVVVGDEATPSGMQPVVEVMQIDQEMRELIRSGSVASEKIYAIATQQLQYESLVMAGARYVQTGVAKIADCRRTLDSYPVAKSINSLRNGLCKKYGISLAQVSKFIDDFSMKVESKYRDDEKMSELHLYIDLEMQTSAMEKLHEA
jgi:Tfp pilus assembly pilus retraction ATPase PilT